MPSATGVALAMSVRLPQIVPLLIVIKLEEYDYVGAAVLGALMLAFSFVLMFAINGLTHWSNKRLGH